MMSLEPGPNPPVATFLFVFFQIKTMDIALIKYKPGEKYLYTEFIKVIKSWFCGQILSQMHVFISCAYILVPSLSVNSLPYFIHPPPHTQKHTNNNGCKYFF
jgi:hypothetical protein